MKIGMIGAGNVGRALSTAAVRAGHEVTLSAGEPEEARKVAADVGAAAVESNHQTVEGADIVILAVPFDAESSILGELGAALDGKVVVELSNRFAPEQLEGPSNAEQAQRMAPSARIVKAFNTVFAALQPQPSIDGIVLDGYVAGDDGEAKGKVLELVASLGFEPLDVGPLAMARALEGMAVLNISLNMNNGWSWRTGWKLLGPRG